MSSSTSENPFPSVQAKRLARQAQCLENLIHNVKEVLEKWRGGVLVEDVVYSDDTAPEDVHEVIKMLEEQGYKATATTRISYKSRGERFTDGPKAIESIDRVLHISA